jgi:hypothetical protein
MLRKINRKLKQLTFKSKNHLSLINDIKNTPLRHETAANVFDQAIESMVATNHRSVFWGDRLLTLDKSAGFLSDPVFRKAYDAIRGSHAYDQYSSPFSIAWRLHTLVWAAKCGLNVEGDFVECGVFKGDMSWVVSQAVDFAAKGKQFYLYDTFDGFSDKYSSKEDFPDNLNFFDFANNCYKDPSIYPYVCDRFSDRQDVKVIKGVVPDVLLNDAPEKISFLHIDLNSAPAEIGALDILFPRMSKGAILIFDDYGWKDYRKQKDAEDAYMAKLGYEILELPTGQGLVVKR